MTMVTLFFRRGVLLTKLILQKPWLKSSSNGTPALSQDCGDIIGKRCLRIKRYNIVLLLTDIELQTDSLNTCNSSPGQFPFMADFVKTFFPLHTIYLHDVTLQLQKSKLLRILRRLALFIFFLIQLSLISLALYCQVTIKGAVFDISGKRPLEGVSVLATSGKGTTTNVLGIYSITVNETDSIYFSYLNKPTVKFPANTIPSVNNFDISLHVPSNILPEVRVMPPGYKFDSMQNRQDYARIFNFKKPGIGISTSPPGSGGAGVGLDLDELINMFRFKRNRSLLGFQQRLIQEEQDKFIDHRFSKLLVRKITQLTGTELDKFMKLFRPDFEFTQMSNDYEFHYYIKQSFLQYRAVFKAGN